MISGHPLVTCSNKWEESCIIIIVTKRIKICLFTFRSRSSTPSVHDTPRRTPTVTNTSTSRRKATFEEMVINKLETIINIQRENTIRIDQIFGISQQNNLNNGGNAIPENFPQFPINDKKVFKQLEQLLEDKINFDYLVSRLVC